MTDTKLVFQLDFNEVSAISTDLAQPDYLMVKFKLPMFIIDAET